MGTAGRARSARRPGRGGPSRAAPARQAAFVVLRRVFEEGAYADRALRAEAAGLTPRDRALAMQLAYGSVQRRATLDHVAGILGSRRAERLDPPVLAALRLGLFQLLFLDGVPEHAAVNESVELAAQAGRAASGYVNAVLRRAAREGSALIQGIDERDPGGAALRHSLPTWLTERWFSELGADEAVALMRACNEPAEAALRVNELITSPAEVISRLPVESHAAPGLPEGLVLGGPFDAHGSALFEAGAITPQSRGSMLVGRMLAPRARERVLDLCAAPGAKTTHLAALMADEGTLVAVERHPGRAEALRHTCARMRATIAEVSVADAASLQVEEPFDRVLVDPPCSGLGTLQARPDIRWRASPASVHELSGLQGEILDAAAAAAASGGTVVYSVCTISQPEGTGVIGRFLAGHPQFRLAEERQLLPHRDGTDGFYIARLVRDG